jgi:hypothetical protein
VTVTVPHSITGRGMAITISFDLVLCTENRLPVERQNTVTIRQAAAAAAALPGPGGPCPAARVRPGSGPGRQAKAASGDCHDLTETRT